MASKPPPLPPPPSFLHRLINLDTTLSLHLHTVTQPFLPHSLLKSLEISGDGRLFFPLTISLFFSPLFTSTATTPSPLLRSFLADLLLGSLLDLLLVGLIKHLVRRPRPLYNKNMSLTFAVDHWSFPSGHSSRVCFIAAFFYLSSAIIQNVLAQLRSSGVAFADKWNGFLGSDEIKVTNYGILLVCTWAVATSVSRVLLGRHFVFDVVAGACLGVLEAQLVFRFLNYSLLSPIFP